MSNFKSQAKRKRELAKLDKREAKEKKRALRKAENNAAEPTPITTPVAQPVLATLRPAPAPTAARKPLTLAEAVERWKSTKVGQQKKR
jgi:hypothetical protein